MSGQAADDVVTAALRASSGPEYFLSVWRAGTAERRAALLDELAQRAAAGNPGALDLLLSMIETGRLADRAVYGMIVNRGEAEDVLQDVLLAVARSIGSFAGQARFTTWLHTVARNTAISHLRRRREAQLLGDDEPAGGATRISSLVADQIAVRDALAGLPEIYRVPVTLREFDQLPYHDIATRLDLPLNTVKSRIARGRALLARALEQQPSGAEVTPPPGDDS